MTAAETADGTGVACHRVVLLLLNAPPLGRAATVVGDWGDIADGGDCQARGLERANRRFPAAPGTADIDFDHLEAVFHGPAGGIFASKLGGERRALARTLEPGTTGAGPRDDVPVRVRERDKGVIERALDVGTPARDGLTFAPLEAASLVGGTAFCIGHGSLASLTSFLRGACLPQSYG